MSTGCKDVHRLTPALMADVLIIIRINILRALVLVAIIGP